LAGEFYVLSCLNRLHIESDLTFGAHKGVDIIAMINGKKIEIEVKTAMDFPFLLGAKDPTIGHENRNKVYIFVIIGKSHDSHEITMLDVYTFPGKGWQLYGIRKNPKGGKYEAVQEAKNSSYILEKHQNKCESLLDLKD
jgi:hypothetical protein